MTYTEQFSSTIPIAAPLMPYFSHYHVAAGHGWLDGPFHSLRWLCDIPKYFTHNFFNIYILVCAHALHVLNL